jgi:hypothetical protein
LTITSGVPVLKFLEKKTNKMESLKELITQNDLLNDQQKDQW